MTSSSFQFARILPFSLIFFGPNFCLDRPFGFFANSAFIFLVFHLSIEWTFALLVFRSLMIFGHFDALSRLLSCLDMLAYFYAWKNIFLFRWTLFWMNLVFLSKWWILGSSNLMHILFSLTLMEFHFFFLDWVKTHLSLMISYL